MHFLRLPVREFQYFALCELLVTPCASIEKNPGLIGLKTLVKKPIIFRYIL